MDCHSEDFLQSKGMIFNKKFLLYISKIASACNFEICGLITKKKIYFLKNYADNTYDNFLLNPSEYYHFYSDIICLFHSHPEGDCYLSPADIENVQNSNLSSLIYSKEYKKFLFYSSITENKFIFPLSSV